MISFKNINSHFFAATGTIFICCLIFGLFHFDLAGNRAGEDPSSQLTDADLDNLELHLEDFMSDDMMAGEIPATDYEKTPVTDQIDNATKSVSSDKGTFKIAQSEQQLPNAADEQIQEIPVVDTVMKRIEVVKVLKVDTVKLLPEEQAIVAEIREKSQISPSGNENNDWRRKEMEKYRFYQKNYRNIRNFKKVYPYALKTREIISDLNSQLSSMSDDSERKKLIKATEKKLFQEYETAVRTMSTSQGKLLLKLIARETNKTGYQIIKEYKGAFSATFWYGVGRIFGTDLKTEFHKEQEDSIIETIVEKYKADDLY